MKIKTGISIHNRFDFVVRNAKTGEVEQTGQAENIVLDRMYTRLCNFSSYFSQIVFGTGSGTPTPNRTTLFNRVGNKEAATDELVRAFPTSKWVRRITLGTEEFNGNTLTEIGISDTTTNINTHAMITDAEGNPLSIEKTSLRIVDIYATIFVTLYDVDTGLCFYDNGLRDYLTGGSTPNNTLGISNAFEVDVATITGTRVANVAQKKVGISGRFNVDSFNKDVRYLYWMGIGLICEVPRIGVWEGIQKTDVPLGVGDGSIVKYSLPNTLPYTNLENLAVLVDGVVVDFEYRNIGQITLDIAPSVGSIITANYKILNIPKDVNHVLDVNFEIEFGVGQPAPVMPPYIPPQDVIPGETIPYAGDTNYGFFGEVRTEDLINGVDLCSYLGLTAGTLQNGGVPWLKFKLDGKTLFVAKRAIRHSISWNHINDVDAVSGTKQIEINGVNYAIRLLSSEEWDLLIQPVHKDGINPRWWNYENADIWVGGSYNGRATWTSTLSGSIRVIRGSSSVSSSGSGNPSGATVSIGFRPVLEVLL